MTSCSCDCHGHGQSFQPPCSVVGGCGHLHQTALCEFPHRDNEAHELHVGRLCKWHRNRLDWLVNEIRKLDEDLDLIVEAGSAPKENAARGRRLSNPSPPAPANLDVLVLRDPRSHGDVDSLDDAKRQPFAVPYVTEVYCYRVRDERKLTRVVLRHVRQSDGSVLEVPTTVKADIPRSVVGRLDMLLRHHDWIADQDWVGDYIAELSELKRAMSGALRDNTHKFKGSCYVLVGSEACGGDLLQENGTWFVSCKRDRSHTWRSARELAALEIGLNGAKTG